MAHTEATAAKNQGNACFKKRDWAGAIVAYSEGVAIDPTWEVLYSNRSQAYFQLKKYEKAYADAQSCMKVKPDYVKGYHRGANALVRMDRYTDALAVLDAGYKKGFRANKDLSKLDDLIRPKAEIQKAQQVKKMPRLEQIKEKGNAFFKNGDYPAAIKAYETVINGCKAKDLKLKISAHCNKALCLQQQSAFSLVIEECNKALELEPTNAKALMRRSSAFEGMEKYRLALEDVRKVLLRHPSMAVANKAQHRLSNAVRALKAAKRSKNF